MPNMDLLLRNVRDVLHEYGGPRYVGDLVFQIWNIQLLLLTEMKSTHMENSNTVSELTAYKESGNCVPMNYLSK
jgi:hypothetical protein